MAGSCGDALGAPAKPPPVNFSGDGAAEPLRTPWQRTTARDRDEDGSGIRPEDQKDTKLRRRSSHHPRAHSSSPSLLSVYRATAKRGTSSRSGVCHGLLRFGLGHHPQRLFKSDELEDAQSAVFRFEQVPNFERGLGATQGEERRIRGRRFDAGARFVIARFDRGHSAYMRTVAELVAQMIFKTVNAIARHNAALLSLKHLGL